MSNFYFLPWDAKLIKCVGGEHVYGLPEMEYPGLVKVRV